MQSTLSSWMRGAAVSAGVALAVAMAPGAARAGVVSETVNVGSTPTNWSNTLSFLGFDALAPGNVLNSVTVALTETLSGSINVTNTSSNSQTGSASLQNTANLTVATLVQVVNAQSTGTLVLAGSSSSGVIPLSGSNTNSLTYTGSSLSYFLSAYTGAASDTGASLLSFGGNATATYVDNGALSVLVTYNYSPAPVPEPTSIALLGFGLLGLGMIRFKRA